MDVHTVNTVHPNGVVEVHNPFAYTIDHPKAVIATCGHCNRSWDDSIATAWTPAPAARCPFEYEHEREG